MKEVTYEEWIKNPTPRKMWCWDFEERMKQKLKVIYVSKEDASYPVVTTAIHDTILEKFRHCAEIEKPRRMTNRELSRWLREKPTREYKRSDRIDIVVYCFYSYIEEDADQEVDENFIIREDAGEWREPLVEVEE